jgi:hypothetical protein
MHAEMGMSKVLYDLDGTRYSSFAVIAVIDSLGNQFLESQEESL